MDRKEWSEIVYEAERRFGEAVTRIKEQNPQDDTAERIMSLAAELVHLFAVHLAAAGRERLP